MPTSRQALLYTAVLIFYYVVTRTTMRAFTMLIISPPAAMLRDIAISLPFSFTLAQRHYWRR